MKNFGAKVSAAAGKSANFEIVPQTTKLGGNGPIMSFALSTLGAPVHYVGMLGYPGNSPRLFRVLPSGQRSIPSLSLA